MENIIQILTDPENQPHQYVGLPDELLKDITVARSASLLAEIQAPECVEEVARRIYEAQPAYDDPDAADAAVRDCISLIRKHQAEQPNTEANYWKTRYKLLEAKQAEQQGVDGISVSEIHRDIFKVCVEPGQPSAHQQAHDIMKIVRPHLRPAEHVDLPLDYLAEILRGAASDCGIKLELDQQRYIIKAVLSAANVKVKE